VFSRLLRNALTIGILCLGIAEATAATAGAAGQIESVLTSTGSSQAGGHPNLTISAALANPGAPETAKSLVVEEPAGLSAYMYSVPRCSLEDLATTECSPDSQVGLATVRARKEANSSFLYGTAPIYAVAAGSGEYGRIAFTIPTLAFTQSIQLGFRSGEDDGLRLTIPNLPVAAPLRSLSVQLWGVPADPAHDEARFPLGSEGCPGLPDFSCNTEPTASGSPLAPLTGYPGSCSPTMPVGFRLETYQDPGVTTTASSSLTGATGCNLLSFNPALSVAAGSETRSTTGLDLDLTVPQEVSPAFPTPPPAKSVELDFSGGLRLMRDPSLSDVVPTCTAEEAAIGIEGPGSCPAETKVGSVRIGTPLVPATLGGPNPLRAAARSGGAHPRQAPAEVTGSVYLGEGANNLYLLGSGLGIDLKLIVSLLHEPESRGLIVSANLPKFPISKIKLRIYPGAGLLRTAVHCGEYPVQSTVSTWNGSLGPSEGTQQLTIDSGPGGASCPGQASQAHLTLLPSQLSADGKSKTTARVSVADASQTPVPGEVVELSSSDPNLQIGPVIDNDDGNYYAELTASDTIGTPTITATVTSVDPEITGSAPLHLVSPSSPASPPPVRPVEPKIDPIPVMKVGKHPPARTRRHRATVSFSADVPGSTFFCKVDGRAVFRPCTSPAKLSGLTVGRHRLSVYAVSPTGATGVPAVVRFTVLPPRPKAG
jgi:hypothetical protein